MSTLRYFLFSTFYFVFLTPIVALAEGLETSVFSSDPVYEMNASIGVGFEYTDNEESTSTNKQTAFINHIYPTFSFKREGGRLAADIFYSGDYSFYMRDGLDAEYSHTFDASLSATIVENLFFISLTESMQQVYESLALSDLEVSDDAGDERNQNVFTISPYFTLQPTQRTNLTFGYTFTDTRYSLGDVSETTSFLSFSEDQYDFSYNVSQSHIGYFTVDHVLSDRATFRMGGTYTRTIYDDEDSIDLTEYNFYLGGSYAFSENLSASFEVGPNYSVTDEGDSSFSPYVQMSLNYSLGRSSFALSYNTSIEDDFESGETVNKSSYTFSYSRAFERAQLSLGLSYNTYDTQSTYRQTAIASQTESAEEDSNTFSPFISFNYDLTPRTKIYARYNAVISEDSSIGDHTHSVNYGITYELSESSTISLSHSFLYAIPHDEDDYYSNRVMLNFNYIF